jgi:hypothetical protein
MQPIRPCSSLWSSIVAHSIRLLTNKAAATQGDVTHMDICARTQKRLELPSVDDAANQTVSVAPKASLGLEAG